MSVTARAACGPADGVRPGLLFAVALLLVAAGILLRLAGWDAPLMLRAHAQAPSAASSIAWSCLTVAGLGWAALILVLAADRRGGQLATLLIPSFLAGSLLTHLPKRIVASPRPAATELLPHLHIIGDTLRGSVSMPSGHALTAAATAALLVLALPLGRRLQAGAGIVLVALLIALSRVVVGAHWPSDITVGAGLGVLAVALPVAALRVASVRRAADALAARIATRTGQRWLAAAEVAAAAGLLSERTGYPAGTPMVVALALLAVASAAWRWRTLPRAAAQPRLPEGGAERT